MLKLGFTGSRHGMSMSQKEQLVLYIQSLNLLSFEFHHGDCVGADAESHDIVREFFPAAKIHIHPPIEISHRAYKTGDVVYQEYSYLARDKNIVDATDVLIGTPQTDNEILRSGTWSTIRYARKYLKNVNILKR